MKKWKEKLKKICNINIQSMNLKKNSYKNILIYFPIKHFFYILFSYYQIYLFTKILQNIMQNLISNELICKYVQTFFMYLLLKYILLLYLYYIYIKKYMYITKIKKIKKSVYKIQYFKLLYFKYNLINLFYYSLNTVKLEIIN